MFGRGLFCAGTLIRARTWIVFSFWALADSGLEPEPATVPCLALGVVSGDIGGWGLSIRIILENIYTVGWSGFR